MKQQNLRDMIRNFVCKTASQLLDIDREHLAVDAKDGAFNFATAYDLKMQKDLIQGLHERMPDAYFLAEETAGLLEHDDLSDELSAKMIFQETIAEKKAEWLFVIDPIDGTSNFMFDLKQSCVSVALFHHQEPFYALVVQPWLGENYEYWEGKAYLNDQVLNVDSEAGIAEGLVGFGTSPYAPELDKKFWDKIIAVFQRSVDIRRMGAAAVDICNVAAGKLQLFFEAELQPWDYSAAKMIAEAAGCKICTLEGKAIKGLEKSSVVVGTAKAVHDFFNLAEVEVKRG